MAKTDSIPPIPRVRRKSISFTANVGRVIVRPFIPPTEERIRNIISRVLELGENKVSTLLETVMDDFATRHRYFREALIGNFIRVVEHLPHGSKLTEQQQLLIGSYFTAEYSVESAALFNPSIVRVASLQTDPKGSCRFVMSFRAVGEGHVSSIEFRSGYIDNNSDMYFDPQGNYVRTPKAHTETTIDRELFRLKLLDMGATSKAIEWLLDDLADIFTMVALQERIDTHNNGTKIRETDKKDVIEKAMWLARSNYEILFRPDHQISERVIFPVAESESAGIEDARFVPFVEDDGTIIYYATYTAYDGETILPQLIETTDFLSFKISTLNGKQAHGKGMALFPRKIGGKYVMLSRQDGENNSIMFSDNIHFWKKATILQKPMFPYEFIQMGNCGSPIETAEGWLVVTHGVGPMRTYSLGIELLDLDDPTRVLSRIGEPILVANELERDGYVPNVVYSCGAMAFKDELIIPYASADQRCGVAALNLPDLLARLRYNMTARGK